MTATRSLRKTEQEAESYLTEDADIVLVAFGGAAGCARSAVNAAREQGIKAGLVRPLTLWPFPTRAIEALVPTAKAFLDVEMNMGQMVEDVRLAVAGRVRWSSSAAPAASSRRRRGAGGHCRFEREGR